LGLQNPFAVRDRGRQHEPLERSALLLQLLGGEIVDGERERHFARGHHLREKAVPSSHRQAVLRRQLAKQPQPGLFPQVPDSLGKPILVGGLDAELSFPARMQEVAIRRWQFRFLHQPRVVGLDEYANRAQATRDARAPRRDQIGVAGRAHRLQQPLAAQELQRHRVAVHDIDFVAPRLGLGDRALEHLLRGGAPGADFHAVLFFERRVQRRDVFRRKRRVQAEETLAARALEQALITPGAFVRGQLGSTPLESAGSGLNRSEARRLRAARAGTLLMPSARIAPVFCAIATLRAGSTRRRDQDTARAPLAPRSHARGASRAPLRRRVHQQARVLTMPLSEETRCSRCGPGSLPCFPARRHPERRHGHAGKAPFDFCASRSINSRAPVRGGDEGASISGT